MGMMGVFLIGGGAREWKLQFVSGFPNRTWTESTVIPLECRQGQFGQNMFGRKGSGGSNLTILRFKTLEKATLPGPTLSDTKVLYFHRD